MRSNSSKPLYLYFNAAIIHANSITFDDFFAPYDIPHPFYPEIDNGNGWIYLIWEAILGTGSVTTNGSFVTISFTAQNQNGVSLLELEGVEILDEDVNVVPTTINNGVVIVALGSTPNEERYRKSIW